MKFNLETPESIQIRESAGLVKDIYDPVVGVQQPLSDYKTFLDLVHRCPSLATAYAIINNFGTYRSFDFIRGTRAERDKLRNLFDVDNLDFQSILPNIFYTLLYYGDCFLELRKNDSKTINELWVLETTEMRIIHDEHGKVFGYVQRPFNMTGMKEEDIIKKEKELIPEAEGGDGIKTQGIFFEADEVIHFRMKWIGSQVYSYNPNEPISQVASTGLYAGNYLMNIFMNMPPRYVAHLAGISNSDYLTAKQQFQSTKTNYKKTIAFTKSSDPNSKLILQKIEPPYDATLIEIIKWINNEIIKITLVPRVWVDGTEAENRGSGESTQRPFDVSIMAIHRNVIEPPINRKLIPAVGKQSKEEKKSEEKPKDDKSKKLKSKSIRKVRFKFNEISRKGEKEILESAGLLKNFGVKPEALVRYLDDRGILGFDVDDFQDPTEMNGGFPGALGGQPKDSFPSRKRMNKGMDDMTQNRNEAGVSDKSGEKMGIKSKSK